MKSSNEKKEERGENSQQSRLKTYIRNCQQACHHEKLTKEEEEERKTRKVTALSQISQTLFELFFVSVSTYTEKKGKTKHDELTATQITTITTTTSQNRKNKHTHTPEEKKPKIAYLLINFFRREKILKK